jgi:hypothetical protein
VAEHVSLCVSGNKIKSREQGRKKIERITHELVSLVKSETKE